MLLQLENPNIDKINKLLSFARENQLDLSVVDDIENSYFLPGRPLTENELQNLIESSRKSGTISLEYAHKIIANSFNAG